MNCSTWALLSAPARSSLVMISLYRKSRLPPCLRRRCGSFGPWRRAPAGAAHSRSFNSLPSGGEEEDRGDIERADHHGARTLPLRAAVSTADRCERRALARCAQQIHELPHRAELLEVVDRLDRAADRGGAEHVRRVGAELALDLR